MTGPLKWNQLAVKLSTVKGNVSSYEAHVLFLLVFYLEFEKHAARVPSGGCGQGQSGTFAGSQVPGSSG